MMRSLSALFITISLVFFGGCKNPSAKQHLEDVRDPSGDRITVGKVQRTIRLGMSNAEVIEILGSPNIVSTDDQRQEVWVYDKVSTETVYSTSSSSGGISALVLGFGKHGGGGAGPSAGSRSATGAHSTTQRTLTIIIKFNKQAKVRDIAYHSSQF